MADEIVNGAAGNATGFDPRIGELGRSGRYWAARGRAHLQNPACRPRPVSLVRICMT
jgi:hypothetical protein